ncbi:sirohydrochlorin cobaltochelatase [Turicibacter sanguinis]|uniref:Sirohydrochlorin cobaltochelatase n=2 Tax=Turicibacter sanguinis TaxID=154288 RepID=A0A9X4XGA1_9FIRM|nr:sirohydrochlorin cobaltochelatase [Turicibacter sanguinis]EFF64830.1 cobalt chelatase (CbiK) [Turicibacter sanguinis PC909]MCU7190326.1 sirohydrochlorin cobaltochelatase [Turicibacter sanguinis]MCU7210836.1 sirohydrochlorin cobaltochelatase [Turicibacter sanguinis]MDB8437183.1 sirohydrochlorin cobaltochelatase [Turicibacter sanguinis]MDB8458541.1 sirohydrochlorin cobaltochelatase [Turicibacter sanguinis]
MKKAVLVVSYGTSYKETREKTIEACEKKIHKSFKDYDFYRAYTSDKIISKIKEREGVEIHNPTKALSQILEKGYDEVLVQSLHIICGDEFNQLKEEVEAYQHKFKKIVLGRPLLSVGHDYEEVAKALEDELFAMNKDEAVVFMGHGMSHKCNQEYLGVESALRSHGINAYVGTIEGTPRLEEVIPRLKAGQVKTVNLMPMMLVVGYHAKKEMIGNSQDSWKNVLESEGFVVNVQLKGLGENIGIQDKFLKHAQECLKEV